MSGRCVPACVMAGLALAGCGAARDDQRDVATSHEDSLQRTGITLAEARSFDEFPLFFAGERVLGHPLVAILNRDDTARYVSFVYGDCEPAGLEGGCAPPVEIQVWPGSVRNLGSYDPSVAGMPTPERTTVRGVPAAFFDGRTRLELFAGPATAVIFSDSRRLLELARALRCVTDPAPGVGVGTLEC